MTHPKQYHLSDPDLLSMLKAIVERLPDAILVCDTDCKLVLSNGAARDICGFTSTLGAPLRMEDFHPMIMTNGAAMTANEFPLFVSIGTGQTVDKADWKFAPEGQIERHMTATASPLHDAAGDQIGAVLILRDDTDRNAKQEELKNAITLKDMLVWEIHHRVKNNLQLVASLLNLQGRRTDDVTAQSAIKDLSQRIDIIADIHRALYESGETDTIEITGYLNRLCDHHISPFVESLDASLQVSVRGHFPLQIEKATSVALALNELIANALQDAGLSRATLVPPLAISIDIDAASEHAMIISYRDNRSRFRPEPDRFRNQGFGYLLITGLEKQLSAKIDQAWSEAGFTMQIYIPFEGNTPTTARPKME